MNFLCVCMSPAVDANVALDKAPRGDGEIFKNVKVAENVGGKAINVARWLAIRGASVVCAGLLGEDNAEPFAKEFAKCGIADRMTRVRGATRRNEMITFPGGSFKLNQAAFPDVAFDESAFLSDLSTLQPSNSSTFQPFNSSTFQPFNPSTFQPSNFSSVVLSGSLPKCCDAGFYAKAVAALKAKGAFVVLDASGEAMKLALEAHPDLIKPNAEECGELVGFVPKTADEFKRATALLRGKAEHVVISDGGSGAWFDGEFFAAPKVGCVDTTSAGDTLLAEYCFSKDPRLAIAAGSAAVEMPGSNPPRIERVIELSNAGGR